jgi:hypothetical protein
MSVTLYEVQFEGGPKDGHVLTLSTDVRLPGFMRIPTPGPPGNPRRYRYDLCTDASGTQTYRYRGVEVVG